MILGNKVVAAAQPHIEVMHDAEGGCALFCWISFYSG
jgi:hypothetical protein